MKTDTSTPNSAPNKPQGVTKIALLEIRPDPQNRKEHDQAELKGLADQIKTEGLLQAIVVRPLAGDELAQKANGAKYQIIAGERRFEAHRLLKRDEIEAKIVEGADELRAVTMQTMENLGRKDLSPLDEARQMRRLQVLKMPQAEIGRLFRGLSQPAVSNALRILELPGPVQEMVGRHELEPAAAVELVRFAPWKKACEFIARAYLKTAWSTKNLRTGVPFADELERAGLGICIATESYYGADSKVYDLPKALRETPGFFESGYRTWIYLLPDDPKAPNLWVPEKERQDKARAIKEAAEKKKAAAAVEKGGKPTKEQRERKKKIEGNKAARAKIKAGLDQVVARLKTVKGIDGAAVALIALKASYGKSPEEAAELLGIKAPMGFDGHSLRWAKLSPRDAVRIAAVSIVAALANEASKFACKVPQEIEFLRKGGAK